MYIIGNVVSPLFLLCNYIMLSCIFKLQYFLSREQKDLSFLLLFSFVWGGGGDAETGLPKGQKEYTWTETLLFDYSIHSVLCPTIPNSDGLTMLIIVLS
jgi:hypothetical protein